MERDEAAEAALAEEIERAMQEHETLWNEVKVLNRMANAKAAELEARIAEVFAAEKAEIAGVIERRAVTCGRLSETKNNLAALRREHKWRQMVPGRRVWWDQAIGWGAQRIHPAKVVGASRARITIELESSGGTYSGKPRRVRLESLRLRPDDLEDGMEGDGNHG